jgi:sterol desaturase/sphingolipid hydroxylase (fatty acid hydroxylase superfamily)
LQAGATPASVVPPIFFASIFWVAAARARASVPARLESTRGRLLADAAYFRSHVARDRGMRSLVARVGVVIAGWISPRVGLSLWPHSWPLLAQLPLAWVVVELFAYWPHRWLHEVPWLWRLHATHHSPSGCTG